MIEERRKDHPELILISTYHELHPFTEPAPSVALHCPGGQCAHAAVSLKPPSPVPYCPAWQNSVHVNAPDIFDHLPIERRKNKQTKIIFLSEHKK